MAGKSQRFPPTEEDAACLSRSYAIPYKILSDMMLLIQRNSRSLVSGPFFTSCLRQFRAWFYRRLPPSSSSMFLKKLAGYERRWGLERNGFTKEGFFHLFRKRFIQKTHPGIFFELQAGDGLVGSLGLWLERENPPWRVEAWEHRPVPAATFALLRPHTP